MNVSLSPELESLIISKVESGMYNSASEVVRAGLRLIQERDELHQNKLAALRADIQLGIDSIEAGRTIDGEEFFDRLIGTKRKDAEIQTIA